MLLVLAVAALSRGEGRADDSIPLHTRKLDAKLLGADESAWGHLRRLPEEGTLELPGGPVSVQQEKRRVKLSWGSGRYNKTVKLSPRGSSVQLRKLGPKEGDFGLLLVEHPRFQTAFVVNSEALEAELGDESVILVDADLDGLYGERREDVVLLVSKERTWALPANRTLPLGSVLGSVRVSGDGSALAIEVVETGADREHREAFATLNGIRVFAGLQECLPDDDLSEACRKHCRYLERNAVPRGASAKDEDPEKPGYTEEGRRAARNGLIEHSDMLASLSVVSFASQFFHRLALLYPKTHRVAIVHEKGINILDALTGVVSASRETPILYPVPGQHDVPRALLAETPSPVPGGGDVAGQPVSVWFGDYHDELSDAKASIVARPGLLPVRCFVAGPDTPACKSIDTNYGAILVLPLEVLQPFTRYDVEVTWKRRGKEGSAAWSFFTGAEELPSFFGNTYRR